MVALADLPLAAFESDIDAGDIHHCMNAAFLIGGVDMEHRVRSVTASRMLSLLL